MKTYTQDELREIIENHKLWWSELGGSRANLQDADLQDADLQGSNLRMAELQGADLRMANLRDANLQDANLQGADLQGAELQGAKLQGANLRGANLQGAKLQDANLQGSILRMANLRDANLQDAKLQDANLQWADLQGAILQDANLQDANLQGANIEISKIIHRRQIVPEFGAFTAFKKAWHEENGNPVVLRLEIPASAKRVGGLIGRKCRASKAKVISAQLADGKKLVGKFNSHHDKYFVYEIGKTYEVADFCDQHQEECAPGIHFFMTRQEAVEC